MKKKYICPICNEERDILDKTEVKYSFNKWIKACQNCFINTIINYKNI